MNLSVGQLIRIATRDEMVMFEGFLDMLMEKLDETFLILEIKDDVLSPFGRADVQPEQKRYLYMKLFSVQKNKTFNYFLLLKDLERNNGIVKDFVVVSDA
jgi:hypothetical protein